MRTFEFVRPKDPAEAVAIAAQAETAQQGANIRFLAGGTTLLDLMKLNVETPVRIIDINRLPLDTIEATPEGGLKIGATVAEFRSRPPSQRCDRIIRSCRRPSSPAHRRSSATWPRPPATCCSERAARISATLRCPATSANRGQDVRRSPAATVLWRFLEPASIASRRTPPTCAWRWRRWKRSIHVQGSNGMRAVPIGEFHLLPGETPHRETVLEPGDLITHVTLPPPPFAGASRDEASLFEAARSSVIRIRFGLRSRPDRRRTRQCNRCARCPGWRRHEAMAITRGRSGADRSGRKPSQLPQSCRDGSARCQAAERERIQNRTGQALPYACAQHGRGSLRRVD